MLHQRTKLLELVFLGSLFALKVKGGVCCYESRFITRRREERKEHFIIKRRYAATARHSTTTNLSVPRIIPT